VSIQIHHSSSWEVRTVEFCNVFIELRVLPFELIKLPIWQRQKKKKTIYLLHFPVWLY